MNPWYCVKVLPDKRGFLMQRVVREMGVSWKNWRIVKKWIAESIEDEL